MNASTGSGFTRRRLLWLLLGAVLLVLVGIGTYNLGLNAGESGVAVGPFGDRFGLGMTYGYTWFGLLGPLLLILLIVGLVAWALTPTSHGQRSSYGQVQEAPRSGVDQLKDLAELHDRGQLSDEEFAAAKRRLLGL